MDRSPSHPIDASGSPVVAIDAVVTGLAATRPTSPADPVVVHYAGHPHDHGWRCAAGALRDVLTPLPSGATLVVCPSSVAVPEWATVAFDPALDALVTARPVTDAVKQVRGGVVVAPVDRSPLRWVTGPAVVRRDAVLAALAGHTDADVVEPLTLLGRIGAGA